MMGSGESKFDEWEYTTIRRRDLRKDRFLKEKNNGPVKMSQKRNAGVQKTRRRNQSPNWD